MPVKRIRFIRKILPEAKMILILRNPIDRVWSSTRWEAGRSNISLENADESKVFEWLRDDGRRANTDYIANLQNWVGIFPKEQFFIGFFKQITEDPQNLLKEIFNFLEFQPR